MGLPPYTEHLREQRERDAESRLLPRDPDTEDTKTIYVPAGAYSRRIKRLDETCVSLKRELRFTQVLAIALFVVAVTTAIFATRGLITAPDVLDLIYQHDRYRQQNEPR